VSEFSGGDFVNTTVDPVTFASSNQR